MAIAKRSIPELAARAERVLAARAREGVEPMTYGELAAAISDDERTYPATGMGAVLKHMGERGQYSWSRSLLAWAVNETGKPSEAYVGSPAGADDPEAERELWHPRIARHFALDEE
ncbi:hypothetical protein [Nocardioides zeae]|uniref:Uncharacterized protein n=1 Tax=Nocardioides zeae TaxID=1457234 RepID=A0A6P0HMY4_9ACTN|nr:hypothetical protein [Nocardioides zeae]NEN79991.1 hypothetical protein [Nocardioides zeae]